MANKVKTINPTTEQTVAEYTLATEQEANEAVDAAHQAFLEWKKTDFDERKRLMNNLADEIEKQSDTILNLMVKEMGKVVEQGKQEIELCAAICRYTADQGASVLKDEDREYEGGSAIITFQPIGVILGIQPWNFPLYQVIRYSAANIMAGNTTVMKHSQNVFGMAELITKLYQDAGFPKHVYHSLLIDGKTASALIQHDKVRGVTFTGSDEVGKSVAETAAGLSKKTVLELGSNDAYVVLSDADIKTAVEACVQGRIVNNGETCVAAKRFIISASVYDEFKQQFLSAFKALKVGDPEAKDTDLGPMAREDLRDKLHNQVKESIDSGANLLLGGEIPDTTGWFYPVTVLENIKPGMPAYDDELFGPVASLIKAESDADAMRIANDSRYGLGGGIFTKDKKKAIKLARDEFDTGMVNINGYSLAQPNLPFGGVKNSGYGREHGGFGMREFVNEKTIFIAD
ncbi:NAD-dependent succinate-semialdehyde dehydrogenase [Glaciecola sp. 1036]|uniref:NAD-dependent succinate-semialdehyde dehydrogenase n=1 Tax=Alteromonadaceae TaxID=72275 RepID=UPI003D04A04D